MFGCEKHGGKLFKDHTDDERIEDGYVHAGKGRWVSVGYRERECVPDGHEYDAGVVPDLASDTGATHWPNYVAGVGPIINTAAEEVAYLKLTGQRRQGGKRAVEVPRLGIGGRVSGCPEHASVSDDPEITWAGTHRRDKDDFIAGAQIRRREMAKAKARQDAAERRRIEPKRFHFMKGVQ